MNNTCEQPIISPLEKALADAGLSGSFEVEAPRQMHSAYVFNLKTQEYERFFTTEYSPLLARNRALEKAKRLNETDPGTYDPDNCIVKKHDVWMVKSKPVIVPEYSSVGCPVKYVYKFEAMPAPVEINGIPYNHMVQRYVETVNGTLTPLDVVYVGPANLAIKVAEAFNNDPDGGYQLPFSTGLKYQTLLGLPPVVYGINGDPDRIWEFCDRMAGMYKAELYKRKKGGERA